MKAVRPPLIASSTITAELRRDLLNTVPNSNPSLCIRLIPLYHRVFELEGGGAKLTIYATDMSRKPWFVYGVMRYGDDVWIIAHEAFSVDRNYEKATQNGALAVFDRLLLVVSAIMEGEYEP
jgi:hypothetical protein